MDVIAVSAALPEWHNVNGKRTLTSIVRKPLDNGVIQVSATGVEGNDTAVHDSPVYAFFAHNYDFWCKELGIERIQWDWCHWGENITFSCHDQILSDADFDIGDIWEIGLVRLQVCGARVPCFKLSWRCDQKESWLKALADSGRCGVYFRVLSTGEIRVGQTARLVQKQTKDTIDCATITRLAFGGSMKTTKVMNLLANNDLVVGILRVFFRRKLAMLVDQEREGKHAWTGWRKFRSRKIVLEAAGLKSFYLEPLDGGPLAIFEPGQFLTVRLPTGDVRSWSMSDWPNDATFPDIYRITIKRSQKASVWMFDSCSTDTVLEVRSPKGNFVLDWKQMYPPRQVYLSAGVGITPIFSMIKAHTSDMNFQSQAIWIHVGRDGGEIPFKNEMDSLLPTLQRTFCFTKPRSYDVLGKDYEVLGRPNKSLLTRLVGGEYRMSISTSGKTFPLEGKQSAFYICGPPAFETEMRASLLELDVPGSVIRSERFAGDGAAELPDLEEATVRFTKSNIETQWHKREPISLLELAERSGLEPDYGCRVGVCGSCSSKITCGTTKGGIQADGDVYICIARPSAPKIEIEI